MKFKIVLLIIFFSASFTGLTYEPNLSNTALKIERAQTVVCTVYLQIFQNVNIVGGDGCSIVLVNASKSFTSWSLSCDDAVGFVTKNACGDGNCGPGTNCSSTFDVYCRIVWTNAPTINWVGRCQINSTQYYTPFTSPTSGGDSGRWIYDIKLDPSTSYSFQICLENFLD